MPRARERFGRWGNGSNLERSPAHVGGCASTPAVGGSVPFEPETGPGALAQGVACRMAEPEAGKKAKVKRFWDETTGGLVRKYHRQSRVPTLFGRPWDRMGSNGITYCCHVLQYVPGWLNIEACMSCLLYSLPFIIGTVIHLPPRKHCLLRPATPCSPTARCMHPSSPRISRPSWLS